MTKQEDHRPLEEVQAAQQHQHRIVQPEIVPQEIVLAETVHRSAIAQVENVPVATANSAESVVRPAQAGPAVAAKVAANSSDARKFANSASKRSKQSITKTFACWPSS